MDVFPAYAGVILCREKVFIKSTSISRIRGGDPNFHLFLIILVMYFPHTRG